MRQLARFVIALVIPLLGCAHARRYERPVSIDSRTVAPSPEAARPAPTRPGLEARVAADTLAATLALRRCAGRTLLAEQESTVQSANELLSGVREALAIGDLARAESLARQARQLTGSLGCP